jgi:hypothetical protein
VGSGADVPSLVFDIITANGTLTALDEISLIDRVADEFFYATVVSVSAVDTPIAGQQTATLDRPIDHLFPFTGGGIIPTLGKIVSSNLAIDGSTTPVMFQIQGGTTPAHINRIIIQMLVTTKPGDNLFGNITALTKGLVIRSYDGFKYTNFNFKTNADIRSNCYDVSYFEATTAGPSGNWGIGARITFNGKDKHGTTIGLGLGDSLQAIVQDDLTTGSPDIVKLQIVSQGHEHAHTSA